MPRTLFASKITSACRRRGSVVRLSRVEPTCRSIVKALTVAGIVAFALGGSAFSQPASQNRGAEELRHAFQNLMTLHESFETTPVDFSLNGVVYRVPRNYIVTMNNWAGGPQEIVTLQVSLPDLKPITPDNVACFNRDPVKRLKGCEPLVFRIGPPSAFTADQAFRRTLSLYRNKEPLPGPRGFELYYYGPDNARAEDYRGFRDGRLTLFSCIIGDVRDRSHGQCAPMGDMTVSGTSLSFWFPSPELSTIIDAEPALRKLVESFVVRRSNASP